MMCAFSGLHFHKKCRWHCVLLYNFLFFLPGRAHQIRDAKCNRMIVFVPQSSDVEPLALNMMLFGSRTFGKEFSSENGAFMKGISALIRRDLRGDIFLLASWKHSNLVAGSKPGSLILDFPASQTVRVICCFYHPSMVSVIWLRHQSKRNNHSWIRAQISFGKESLCSTEVSTQQGRVL